MDRTKGMVADGWGATTDGSSARQATWNAATTSSGPSTHRGDGRYSIANRTTGLVLDSGGNVPSGSITKQWSWLNNTNLQWTFTAL